MSCDVSGSLAAGLRRGWPRRLGGLPRMRDRGAGAVADRRADDRADRAEHERARQRAGRDATYALIRLHACRRETQSHHGCGENSFHARLPAIVLMAPTQAFSISVASIGRRCDRIVKALRLWELRGGIVVRRG
jgi:hypothetical protein